MASLWLQGGESCVLGVRYSACVLFGQQQPLCLHTSPSTLIRPRCALVYRLPRHTLRSSCCLGAARRSCSGNELGTSQLKGLLFWLNVLCTFVGLICVKLYSKNVFNNSVRDETDFFHSREKILLPKWYSCIYIN